MKIFLSWSGNTSHKVALVLNDWLPSVIQSITTYIASEDIYKVARWGKDITYELGNSTYGILCVTSDNINSPWLNFEAGALAKNMDMSFVNSFLFNIKRSEVCGPILQFQSTIFEKDDIYKLVKSLNAAGGESKLNDDILSATFNVWYSSLETNLNNILLNCHEEIVEIVEKNGDSDSNRNNEINAEILEEILELKRMNQMNLIEQNNINDGKIDEINTKLKELLNNSVEDHSNDSNINDSKIDEINIKMNELLKSIEEDSNLKKVDKRQLIMTDELFFNNSEINVDYKLRILLSVLKEQIPGIYDIGIETLNIIKSTKEEKYRNTLVTHFRRNLKISYTRYIEVEEHSYYNNLIEEIDTGFEKLMKEYGGIHEICFKA